MSSNRLGRTEKAQWGFLLVPDLTMEDLVTIVNPKAGILILQGLGLWNQEFDTLGAAPIHPVTSTKRTDSPNRIRNTHLLA